MGNNQKQSLRPFFVLWSGQAVSLLGSQLVQFALIWWLTQTTGSATVLATASLVGLLPQVILGPFIGVLVDRWNRRVTMMLSDSVVAVATLFLFYLFWNGQEQIWHVFVLLFIRAVSGSFHFPAFQSSTSMMVTKDQLTRIQGLNQTLQGGLNIASAPLAALLLSLMPMQGILAIDVVTAGIAVVILLFIHIPQPEKTVDGVAATMPSSFWSDMYAGLNYMWSAPGILLLMLMAMMINLLLNPAFSLLPLLVKDHFGGDALQLGGLESTFGIGILVGGLLLSTWGGFKRRILTTLLGLVGLSIGILLLGFAPPTAFTLAVVAMFLVGFTNSLTNGPVIAIFQACIAPEMQGRAFTLISSLSAAMSPLGLILAGPIADAFGIQTWYIAGGLMTLLMALAGFLIPAVYYIEDEMDSTELLPTPSITEAAVGDGVVH